MNLGPIGVPKRRLKNTILLFLWLHYPIRTSAYVGAVLHPSLSCATCLQLTVPFFVIAFSRSSFHLALGIPLGSFWCKLAWYIFSVNYHSMLREIPKERKSPLHSDGNLKSCNFYIYILIPSSGIRWNKSYLKIIFAFKYRPLQRVTYSCAALCCMSLFHCSLFQGPFSTLLVFQELSFDFACVLV
jgi:hypothetical protein